jgi:hypothetical protein
MIQGRWLVHMNLFLLIGSVIAFAQSDTSSSLLTAAYDGDVARIQELISNHADVNATNNDGVTALMIAAGANKTDVMKVLIQSHADVNRKTRNGNTALIFATGKGNKEAVRILLAAGASASAKTPDGLTLLELANQKQQPEIAQLLAEWIETGGASSSGPIYKPRAFPVDPKAGQKPADPELVATLESLKQTVLSSGRVTYTVGVDYTEWQQIASVLADARGCRTTADFDGHPRSKTTLFFESIDTVEALGLKESQVRDGYGTLRPWVGGVYVVAINGKSSSLRFGSEAQATEAARAVRRAAEICRAAPVVVIPAAGAPSLADTLHFIENKLNENGAVNFRGSYAHPDGSALPDYSDMKSFSESQRMSDASADPSTCQARFNWSRTRDSERGFNRLMRISFRRVEKLEVATLQDAFKRNRPSPILTTEPVVYQLRLTLVGGDQMDLLFGEEEMANRVAKAMTHAAELCGGGGSKEPF